MVTKLSLGNAIATLFSNFTKDEQYKLRNDYRTTNGGLTIQSIAENYNSLFNLLVELNVNRELAHNIAKSNMNNLPTTYKTLIYQTHMMGILNELLERGDLGINPQRVHAVRMAYKADRKEFTAGQLFKALESGVVSYSGKSITRLTLDYPLTHENKRMIHKIGEDATRPESHSIPQVVTIDIYPVTEKEVIIRKRLARLSETTCIKQYGMTKLELMFLSDLSETKLQVFEATTRHITGMYKKNTTPTRARLISAKEQTLINRIEIMSSEERIRLYGARKSDLLSIIPLTEEALIKRERTIILCRLAKFSAESLQELFGLSIDELKAKTTLTHDTVEILKLIQRTDKSKVEKLFGTSKEEVLRREDLTTLNHMLSLGDDDISLTLLIAHNEIYSIKRLQDPNFMSDMHISVNQKNIIKEHHEVMAILNKISIDEAEILYGTARHGSSIKDIKSNYPLSYAILRSYERKAITNRLMQCTDEAIKSCYGLTKSELLGRDSLTCNILTTLITVNNMPDDVVIKNYGAPKSEILRRQTGIVVLEKDHFGIETHEEAKTRIITNINNRLSVGYKETKAAQYADTVPFRNDTPTINQALTAMEQTRDNFKVKIIRPFTICTSKQ